MDKIHKVVFSRTLNGVDWDNARLATGSIEEEVKALKQQPGGDILVGSRSLIIQLLKLNLLDEFQVCMHPVIAGGGLPLFEDMNDRKLLKLSKTKTFSSGAMVLYYQPVR